MQPGLRTPALYEASFYLLQKARAKGKILSSWKEAFMKAMTFELNFNGWVEFQEGNIREENGTCKDGEHQLCIGNGISSLSAV